ncbi:MAG: hybrid sensor histidine kinase/response regulator [Opitutales bacterium]
MAQAPGSFTILVIEDDPGIRENLSDVLILEGYRVSSAENGIDGCALAQSIVPDLIICDVMMPELDGYGVLQKLRENEETDAIPFIFLSAKTERADMRSGLGLGADDYLTKPVDIDELLASVQLRINRAAVQRRQAEKQQVEQWGSLPHEINTPLNGIISSAELYLSMIRAGENFNNNELADVFEIILDSGYRLHRFTEKYIRYFELVQQTKSPNTRVEPEPLSISPLIQEATRDLTHQFGREEDLYLDLQEDAVVGLRFWIFQSINNLIENAYKFSEQGTQVAIIGKVDRDRYCIRIVDHGRGMTSEQISEIGPFKQFERDKFEQQGFGLGLFNAREGIFLSGGTFEAFPVTPQGLRIEISLPRAD